MNIKSWDLRVYGDYEKQSNELLPELKEKEMIQEAKDNKTAVDATCGRRTRAVIITDSGHIILSAVQPETVAGRFGKDATTVASPISEEE